MFSDHATVLDLNILTAAYYAWGDARLCDSALWLASLPDSTSSVGHLEPLSMWMPKAASLLSTQGGSKPIILLMGLSAHAQFGLVHHGTLRGMLGVPVLGVGSVTPAFSSVFNEQLTHRVRSTLGLISLREHCKSLAHECVDDWAKDLARVALETAPCAVFLPHEPVLSSALEMALQRLVPSDLHAHTVRRSLEPLAKDTDDDQETADSSAEESVKVAEASLSDTSDESVRDAVPPQPKPLSRKEKRSMRQRRFAFWARGKACENARK